MGDAANVGKTTTSGTLELSDAARLSVESGIGEIVISSYPYSESQTGSRRVVEWQAAYEADGDVVPVEAANGPDGAVLRTRSSSGPRHDATWRNASGVIQPSSVSPSAQVTNGRSISPGRSGRNPSRR